MTKWYRCVTSADKDGHDEGDVGAKDGRGWTAVWKKPTLDSLSFNSGTSYLFRVNSKVRFQMSNSAFMALADPSDLVRASVPLPDMQGSSGGILLSFFPPPYWIQRWTQTLQRVQILYPSLSSQYCLYLPSLSSAPLLLFYSCSHLFYRYTIYWSLFWAETSVQERIHMCSMDEVWYLV